MVAESRRLGPEFDEFVQDSSGGLLRLARFLTQDRGSAEDLVQVCLVRVAGRWPAARGNPRPYARRMLVNLARNRWRDRARRPIEVPLVSGAREPASPSIEDQLADRDGLVRLLAQLPVGQRSVLVLRYFEDLPVAEVAAIIGRSEGTVKSQTSRALDALRHRCSPSAARPPCSSSVLRRAGRT